MRQPLHELHAHRTVCLNSDRRIRIAEYLDGLRRDAERGGWGSHAAKAYDLALDRFLGKSVGVYKAILNRVSNEVLDVFEFEKLLAELLRKAVARHFRWCLKEAVRSMEQSRFQWHGLNLLMPKTISGPFRRKWLESHVENVDRDRPGEEARIQGIIDEAFSSKPIELVGEWDLPSVVKKRLDATGLMETVADEKATNLEDLRPSIRSLGSSKVRTLVIDIFESILDDSYSEREIAKRYRLSTSTMTRFAGLHVTGTLADLWRNAAGVLARDDDLWSGAKEGGWVPV